MKTDPERFIRANTALGQVPLVGGICLFMANEAHELWHKTEDELDEMGLPPPFWAFAWAGGQALARYVLDHPDLVAGQRVVDFGAGSGLVGIAALKAGAAEVTAIDIDPWSAIAIRLNAAENGVRLTIRNDDAIGQFPDADVLLAGDVFYDSGLARRIIPWFQALAERGITVLAGDPHRRYRPAREADMLDVIDVPVSRALEDADVKATAILRFRPANR